MDGDHKEFNFHVYVKLVLQDEIDRTDKFLTREEISTLLSEECSDSKPRESIIGYPTYPLYREIGHLFHSWFEKRHCPALDLPQFELLDEKTYYEQREITFKKIIPLLDGLKSLWSLWSEEEVKFRVREILTQLGLRGILDLLGLRKTIGTKDLLPPPRNKLINSFCAKYCEKSILSVGARALSKHFHRDDSSRWWGEFTGKEQEKNDHALSLCNRILDNAVWINIHWLVHDVFIIEAREDHGYGLRWLADGSNFRGFLEPQMVGGHEVGWKH